MISYHTGWFKLKTPNSFRVKMSTPFLRDETLKFRTRVQCIPAEAFTNVFVHVFFPPDIWVLYFGGYLGFQGIPDFQRKKKKKKKVKGLPGTH